MNESVGKKIVDALKRQAEADFSSTVVSSPVFSSRKKVETEPVVSEEVLPKTEEASIVSDSFGDIFAEEPASVNTNTITEDNFDIGGFPESNFQQSEPSAFEMPSNIVVLKKLIAQLPSGVSRHTGAQIIKQTMEALGISMRSVLQDAQQVQENLKNSAKECQSYIQEYKKQIVTLEKQSQNYQKQYAALNDLISLFIQANK